EVLSLPAVFQTSVYAPTSVLLPPKLFKSASLPRNVLLPLTSQPSRQSAWAGGKTAKQANANSARGGQVIFVIVFICLFPFIYGISRLKFLKSGLCALAQSRAASL